MSKSITSVLCLEVELIQFELVQVQIEVVPHVHSIVKPHYSKRVRLVEGHDSPFVVAVPSCVGAPGEP